MALFDIEATFRLPHYRVHTYEAETLEAACALAIEDQDWDDQKRDFETAGDTYITDAWTGGNE